MTVTGSFARDFILGHISLIPEIPNRLIGISEHLSRGCASRLRRRHIRSRFDHRNEFALFPCFRWLTSNSDTSCRRYGQGTTQRRETVCRKDLVDELLKRAERLPIWPQLAKSLRAHPAGRHEMSPNPLSAVMKKTRSATIFGQSSGSCSPPHPCSRTVRIWAPVAESWSAMLRERSSSSFTRIRKIRRLACFGLPPRRTGLQHSLHRA